MVPRALALNDDAEVFSYSTPYSGSVTPTGSNFSVTPAAASSSTFPTPQTGGSVSIAQETATPAASRPTGRVVLEALETTPSGPVVGFGSRPAAGADLFGGSISSNENGSSKKSLSPSLLPPTTETGAVAGVGEGGLALDTGLHHFSQGVSDGAGIGNPTSEATGGAAVGDKTNPNEADNGNIKSGNDEDANNGNRGNRGGGGRRSSGDSKEPAIPAPLPLAVSPAKEEAAADSARRSRDEFPKPRVSSTGAGGRPIKLIHSHAENGPSVRSTGGSFVGLRSIPVFFQRNGSKAGLWRNSTQEGSRRTDESSARKTGGKWSMLYSSRSKAGENEDDQPGTVEEHLAMERAKKNWRVVRAVFMALGRIFRIFFWWIVTSTVVL